jgi:hypothetical protein
LEGEKSVFFFFRTLSLDFISLSLSLSLSLSFSLSLSLSLSLLSYRQLVFGKSRADAAEADELGVLC